MIRVTLLALAVFFCLSCGRKLTPTDADIIYTASADSDGAAAAVVDPAAHTHTHPAVGPDAGTVIVMPEAKISSYKAPVAPTVSVDVNPILTPTAP